MQDTVSFGYWVRRRRKALDLTQEGLAYQVGCATVSIKKIERDERRPSRMMAERLAEILLIPTTERETFIHCGLGEVPVDILEVSAHPLTPLPRRNETKKPIDSVAGGWNQFVGREPELFWLAEQLDLVTHGECRLAFIAGEAGCGKTALMAEFTRIATASNPELLVASGNCTAFAGIGDPYLPFREIMGLLTGDIEFHGSSAAQSQENILRLWQSLPVTLQALVEHGSHLLDIFVSGNEVLARAKAAAPGGAAWLTQLQAIVARRHAVDRSPEQSALFEGFTDFLRRLAEHHPILLLFDDLHWADEASISLLFHLGRRLSRSRILILGAYRPEELATGLDSERHLLDDVLAEFKRTYGNVWIDLAAADQAEGKDFVEAFLDSEPNQFGEAFRRALFRQTGGHPLFTVELLREMQARGDLVKDRSGQWRVGEELDWDTLPARVEAVIARRLDRLDASLRDILTIASIEGEIFTVEVVARVMGIEERLLLQYLAQQLARRHHLVGERGEVDVGGRYLSLYQFGHILFQQYLYHQLSPGERRRLHGEVAGALEALYRDQADSIAVQLASHFQEARMPQKAVGYLRRAGERAIRLSAVGEAVNLLGRGLALLKTLPATPDRAQHELKIRIALAEAQRKAGQYTESLDTYQQAAAIARELGSSEDLARAALGYEETRWRFDLPAEPAVHLLREALKGLEKKDSILQVRVWVSLAKALMSTSTPEQVAAMSQQAMEIARRVNDPQALYNAVNLKIRGDRRPEQSAERMALMDEMLQLAEEAGVREGTLEINGFRMQEYLELGEIQSWLDEFDAFAPLVKKVNLPFENYSFHLSQMMQTWLDGRFDDAEQLAQQALEIGKQMHVENVEGLFGIQMFTIRREQGRLAVLGPLVKMFVEQHSATAVWRPGLALIYTELGLREEAQREFEFLAANEFADVPQDGLWTASIGFLSEVCAFLGDANRAASLYGLLLPYAERNIVVGFLSVFYGAAARYLGILAATRSRWEEAEKHFQDAIAMNARMGARPWLAHTQYQYSAMLLARRNPDDRGRAMSLLDKALKTAYELGMKSLSEKAEALKRAYHPIN
jgi:transcriptional regulator with XRE-family HTH domain/tetratricopeptide (TPR) repeat protein